MSKSVISNEQECYRCHTRYNLHRHHIFSTAYRKKAEELGYWVYLCVDCHTGSRGVHTTHEGKLYWDELKRIAQRKYEENGTREDFIKTFGRNYL